MMNITREQRIDVNDYQRDALQITLRVQARKFVGVLAVYHRGLAAASDVVAPLMHRHFEALGAAVRFAQLPHKSTKLVAKHTCYRAV